MYKFRYNIKLAQAPRELQIVLVFQNTQGIQSLAACRGKARKIYFERFLKTRVIHINNVDELYYEKEKVIFYFFSPLLVRIEYMESVIFIQCRVV